MPPTGVALRDPRQQLFDAAERILLRHGPSRLTSREVTDEAGCAKGVLHRHFSSFETFLADLVLDRTAWLDTQATLLVASAGTGDLVDLVAEAVTAMLDPTRLAIVSLVTFRRDVREGVRERWLTGVPVLVDVALAVSGCLRAEIAGGRLAASIAPETLGRAIVGSAYQILLGGDPDAAALVRTDVARLLAAGRSAGPKP